MEAVKQRRFVFISNYLNHHQIPFCRAMQERLRGSFAFIQTQPMEEERLRMGWNGTLAEPYLELYYEKPEECREMIRRADVVFFGGTEDESYVQERLQTGKTVMRVSERLYREGQWKAISPRGLRKKYLDHVRYRKAPVYLFCCGAYVPSDFHLIRAYPQKMFCWGYFPETKQYDLTQLMAGKGYAEKEGAAGIPRLLWAARLIQLKHPELAVETAKHLKERGIAFHLDLIGGGPMEGQIRNRIREYGLEEEVSLLGFMKPEEVRSYMERADVFLFTSDRREGWGAVVNEAMNSGCAVVADHMVGAAPYLIRHGENGFVYRDGNRSMLFETVEKLVLDEELRRQVGKRAYETIRDVWNAEKAAERLCSLTEQLTGVRLDEKGTGATDPDGKGMTAGEAKGFAPCAPATVISERKMFHFLTGK